MAAQLQEATLEQTQRRLGAIFENSLDAILLLDDAGRYMDGNSAVLQLLGYNREELLQLTVWDVTPLQDHARIPELLSWLLSQGTLNGEYTFVCKGGKTREVKYRAVANILPGVHLAILRDISERKSADEKVRRSEARLAEAQRQAQEQFRRSEERLQVAVLAAKLGIFEHDHCQDTLYWSPALRDLSGWGAEEPASFSAYLELIHPEDREARVAALRQAHDPAGAGVDTFEHRVQRRDGSVRWVRCCARTQFEGEGAARRPVRTTGSVADITEQKQAEEARNLLASIVESAQDAIVSKTLDGIITSWNAGAERLLGYSAREVIGKDNSLIIPADRLDAEPEFLEEIALGKSIEHYETVRLHKSGRRVEVVLSLSPVRDSAGTVIGFAKIMHDITARKLLEKEVLEIATREQRRIGQELHDSIGQELTALSLLAETLAEIVEGRPPAEVAIVAKIVKGLDRALGQIRAVARGLIPVVVDTRGLQASLEELVSRTNELSMATCSLDCRGKHVEVADNRTATQLFHIAQEAVTNALRHGKASHILLSLQEDDQTLTLRVLDDGVGFLKEQVEGEGMGLKIMHYRAGLINGRLAIHSREPVGTVVTCTVFKGATDEQEPEQRE